MGAVLAVRQEQLDEIVHRYGITVSDIALRDPDYLSPPGA